ncbi:MAG: hypothetical protein Q4D06_00780 [Coriobacteriia bacterium]|nr:hypothetical protein [Coriobacteriia bacterium]
MTSNRTRKRLASAALALALGSCTVALSGCLESDVLVNYVHDQQNGTVDPTRKEKIYVPDENAAQTMENVATASHQTTEELHKTIKDQAALSDKRNTEKKAEKTRKTKVQDSPSTAPKSKPKKDGTPKKKPAKKSDGKKDQEQTTPPKPTTPEEQGNRNSKVTEKNNVHDSSMGNTEDLPKDVMKACATGEAATMVMSLGGKGALAGSSKEYLANSHINKVFKDRDVAKAATCWSGYGAGSKSFDADKVIKSAADTVFVISGLNTLTPAQEKKLGRAHVRVVVLPALTSDTNIRTAMTIVGKCFSKATDGASEKAAKAYAETVDAALADAKNAHGGKVATYAERDYNNAGTSFKTVSGSMPDPNWCLYVNDWDEDAVVSASYEGKSVCSNARGVATTYVGWTWSPISYYLSCGGALNNGAAYGEKRYTSIHRAVLQFSENMVSYSWTRKPADVTLGGKGGAFDDHDSSLMNGYDAVDSPSLNDAHPIGQSDFTKMIVRTKQIKKAVTEAQGANLYAPASFLRLNGVQGYGVEVDGKLMYTYSTRKDTTHTTDDGQVMDTGYQVVVNPEGLVGSWTAGSMESFLEALWISSEYYPDAVSTSHVKTRIADFYQQFYGYEPTDDELSNILSGSYAK